MTSTATIINAAILMAISAAGAVIQMPISIDAGNEQLPIKTVLNTEHNRPVALRYTNGILYAQLLFPKDTQFSTFRSFFGTDPTVGEIIVIASIPYMVTSFDGQTKNGTKAELDYHAFA